MKKEEVQMHLTAALACGREVACGTKSRYGTEKAAEIAARSLNKRPPEKRKRHAEQEPYPCPFCDRWHVGRKMSQEERGFWGGLYKLMSCPCGRGEFRKCGSCPYPFCIYHGGGKPTALG